MLTKNLVYLSLAFTAVMAQTYVGTVFYFVPGLGACGYPNADSDIVASVSEAFFNSYPGATPNPNTNPLCLRSVLVTNGTKNVTAAIVDNFVSDEQYNIGLSSAAFQKVGDLDDGRIPNVSWTLVENTEQ